MVVLPVRGTLPVMAEVDEGPAPPAVPIAGQPYLVPPNATGAWEDQDRKIAVWFDAPGAWGFSDQRSGYTASTIEQEALSGVSRPLFYAHNGYDYYPTTKRFDQSIYHTGAYSVGPAGGTANAREMALEFSFGVGPNNGTRSVAHGISNIDLRATFIEYASASSASICIAIPAVIGGTQSLAITVDVTNVNVISNFDASGYQIDMRISFFQTNNSLPDLT